MEDFKKAAELRDLIRDMTEKDPVARLLAQLKVSTNHASHRGRALACREVASARHGVMLP